MSVNKNMSSCCWQQEKNQGVKQSFIIREQRAAVKNVRQETEEARLLRTSENLGHFRVSQNFLLSKLETYKDHF